MKKPLVLGLTTMLTLGTLAPIAQANENTSDETTELPKVLVTETTLDELPESLITENSSDIISEVEPYVHRDKQGFLYVDNSIPRELYIQNKVDLLEKSFEEINKQVESGQVVINDDLSITSNRFTTFASGNGYTSETFWWGERATYNNAQTKSAVKSLTDASIDITFIAAATFWVPSIAAGSMLTAAYCGKLGKDMDAKNKGKGVILDMTWVLAYTVKSR